MKHFNLRHRQLEKEISFNASRSGGPGGQHANKTATQVELRFNVMSSQILSHWEKKRIQEKIGNQLTAGGELIITDASSRSQVKNRRQAMEKLFNTLQYALKRPKKRKPTQPTRAAKRKRLEEKKKHSEKKNLRKPPDSS